MLTRFKDFIEQQSLFDPSGQVLLAVSGGLDSMVMADLFRKTGIRCSVAHSNFQLRGGESDADEAFVKEWCVKSDVVFHSKRFETNNYAGKSGISIQMAARELRYEWFASLLADLKIPVLATAHHLNDNLETVLLRWTMGANLQMLTGIPVRQGNVVRPLLFATREEVRLYAEENKIRWREDASNSSDDYSRNFVRHQVVPRLKEINPSLEKTFADSLDKIKGSLELMTRGLDQLKDSITRTEGQNFLIDMSLLKLMKNPAFICHEWLKSFGFDWDRCIQLTESMDGQSGKKFLSGTHVAVIDRESIIVSPLQEINEEILIEEGQDKAALGTWRLTLKVSAEIKASRNSQTATLDGARLKFPLLWRKWKSGDYFYPLGMTHRKKISDFLIDEKIPVSEKSQVTVIESGGEVAWVVGYRIDDRFKVSDSSHVVLDLSAHRI